MLPPPLTHTPPNNPPSHLDRLCMKGSWNKDRSLSSFDIFVTILCQLIIIHLHLIIWKEECFLIQEKKAILLFLSSGYWLSLKKKKKSRGPSPKTRTGYGWKTIHLLMEVSRDRLVRANEACIKDLFSLEGTAEWGTKNPIWIYRFSADSSQLPKQYPWCCSNEKEIKNAGTFVVTFHAAGCFHFSIIQSVAHWPSKPMTKSASSVFFNFSHSSSSESAISPWDLKAFAI